MYASVTRYPGDAFAGFETLQQLLGLGRRAVQRGAFPAINTGSTNEAFEIHAFAPGIDIGKLDVTVDKDLLTISGERASELPAESEKLSVSRAERFAGTFKRVVSLPEDADSSRVEASYRDGILRIVIARRESSKPRRIDVKSAQ